MKIEVEIRDDNIDAIVRTVCAETFDTRQGQGMGVKIIREQVWKSLDGIDLSEKIDAAIEKMINNVIETVTRASLEDLIRKKVREMRAAGKFDDLFMRKISDA